MGIAWFDDVDLSPDEASLRLGGLPLLGEHQAWPSCLDCSVPMLFRGQIPLALTSLVGPSDGRVLAIFECHARVHGSSCLEGAVVVTRGTCAPREAPLPNRFDVVLDALGPDEDSVQRVMEAFGDQFDSANDNHGLDDPLSAHTVLPRMQSQPPIVMMANVTDEIGHSALSMVEQLGARGRLDRKSVV